MATVRIGDQEVGDGQPCHMLADKIGINHNGDPELAKKLMTVASAAGCNAVKFQKRTIDVVYTATSWPASGKAPSATPTAT